jgi:hypothetical protein
LIPSAKQDPGRYAFGTVNVSVTWNTKENSKLSGRIICLWSDANAGEIPAFDEVQHYLPVWAIPSKISDGLVEGYKHFQI